MAQAGQAGALPASYRLDRPGGGRIAQAAPRSATILLLGPPAWCSAALVLLAYLKTFNSVTWGGARVSDHILIFRDESEQLCKLVELLQPQADGVNGDECLSARA